MTPDPKQLARTVAQKYLRTILADRSGLDYRESVDDEVAVEIEEELAAFLFSELNLEQLIADKQRLDWLEQTDIHGALQFQNALSECLLAKTGNIRQAIDNAMKGEQK